MKPPDWAAILPRDYRDILAEFIEAGVDFLVIGGWAMAAHGHHRATKDIDLFVRPSPANAARVMTALAAFGAPLGDVRTEEFATPGLIFQVGVRDRVDVTTTIDGLDFDAARDQEVVMKVGGLSVPVIGLTALIANKRASGRAQDVADVEALEQMTLEHSRPRR